MAAVLLCLWACGPETADVPGGGSSESTGADDGAQGSDASEGSSAGSSVSSAGEGTSAGTSSASSTTADPSTTTTDSGDPGDEGSSWIAPPDASCESSPTPGPGLNACGYCDVFSQDCPPESKCIPTYYGRGGGGFVPPVVCSPLAPEPKAIGEACTLEVVGDDFSDDCERGGWCWKPDPNAGVGTCVALCSGTPSSPTCPPETACAQFNYGWAPVCLPTCDPLLQDCESGDACIGTVGTLDVYATIEGFVCAPAEDGELGDTCSLTCGPGLACVETELLPSCDSDYFCCADFCDVTLADSEVQCGLAAQGATCMPYYEPPWPGAENVGLCRLP